MNKLFSTAAVVAVAVVLSSCGSADQGAQTPQAASSEATKPADASNPFADAEMRMNEKMMAATGADAGDNWARKMIEHHQGAIDMSRIMLEQNPTPDVEKMAREGIEKQQKDIEDIRKLVKDGAADKKSAELYRPAMMEMHQKMMAATGTDASETFMRKMLEHHRGAVAMSDVALQNGVSGALREQVQKTKDGNQKDAAMVEAMLSGKSRQEAMAMSGAKSAAQAKAEPAPADKPRVAPQARATPAKPKAEPQATQAPSPTDSPAPAASKAPCLPEHKTAGHC